MEENREYLEQYKALTDVFLANGGIQKLTDTAFAIFHTPLYVLDTSGRVLAASPSRQSPSLDEAEMDALKQAGIFEKAAQTNGFYSFVYPCGNYPGIACSIRIRNTVVAYGMLIARASSECQSPESFTSVQKELFLTFRDLLTQELMKNRSYQDNRDEYMSYLLMDMLTNKNPDEKTIQKRLETVDFSPADHMNVVVIRKRLEGVKSCSFELIAMQLKPDLSGAISATVEDSLVLLFNFPAEKKIDDTILSRLRQVCANNDLIAGISSCFTSLSDLTRHYRLAVRTALVCQRYIEDHRVIFYDDVFDLALLEYCDRHNNLMDYVHSSILRLMDYDACYGTDYLYTFWIYTECGCNTQASAARLYIHKNTLVYRINKIKELLDSDLTSGKDLFAFQLSMRILRMLGRLEK